LSKRVLDILRLIVKGLSNKQIAGTLGITEGTVNRGGCRTIAGYEAMHANP